MKRESFRRWARAAFWCRDARFGDGLIGADTSIDEAAAAGETDASRLVAFAISCSGVAGIEVKLGGVVGVVAAEDEGNKSGVA